MIFFKKNIQLFEKLLKPSLGKVFGASLPLLWDFQMLGWDFPAFLAILGLGMLGVEVFGL